MPRSMLEANRLREIPPYENCPRSPRLSILRTSKYLHDEVSEELCRQRIISLSVDACCLDPEVQNSDLLFKSLRWPGYRLLPWGRLKAIRIVISGPTRSAEYYEFSACVISAFHQMEELVSVLSTTRKLPTMLIEFPLSDTCTWLPGLGKDGMASCLPIFNAVSRQYSRSIDLILSPLRRLRHVHRVHLELPKGFERFDCEFDIPKPLESLMTIPHGFESLQETAAMESVLDAHDLLCDLYLDDLYGSKAGQLRVLRLMRWDAYLKKTEQQFKTCRSLRHDLKLAAWEMLHERKIIHKRLTYGISLEETLRKISKHYPDGLPRLSYMKTSDHWRGSVTKYCLQFASYGKVIRRKVSQERVRGRARIAESTDEVYAPWDVLESEPKWKTLHNRHLHRMCTPCRCYRMPSGTGRKKIRASWSTDRLSPSCLSSLATSNLDGQVLEGSWFTLLVDYGCEREIN